MSPKTYLRFRSVRMNSEWRTNVEHRRIKRIVFNLASLYTQYIEDESPKNHPRRLLDLVDNARFIFQQKDCIYGLRRPRGNEGADDVRSLFGQRSRV